MLKHTLTQIFFFLSPSLFSFPEYESYEINNIWQADLICEVEGM